MLQQITPAAYQAPRLQPLNSRSATSARSNGLIEESLPFTVKLVRSADDLDKAIAVRYEAYARHLPLFAETLRSPEEADSEEGTVILLAESKLDGSALGSMRIQTNEFQPLSVEKSVALPPWLQTCRLAEASRLGVSHKTGGRLVTTVLFKAFYLYCHQIGTEWMVVTGRSPMDRQYKGLLYADVFPESGYIPLSHVGNIPHRVMTSNVESAEARWLDAAHPLFNFAFRTNHPDIQLDESKRYGNLSNTTRQKMTNSINQAYVN